VGEKPVAVPLAHQEAHMKLPGIKPASSK
jgi:hypothetical protein